MKSMSFLQKIKTTHGNAILLFVILVGTVSLMSSCSKGEDNDHNSDESEKPYDPNNQMDAAMAAWLAGTWGYSDSNGSVYIDNMYEFKKDGTFYKILSSGVSGGRQATAFSGKYRISDNKLTLYKQLRSTGPATATHFDKIWYIEMDSYDTKDVPWEDTVYEISKEDNDILRFVISEATYLDYKRGR